MGHVISTFWQRGNIATMRKPGGVSCYEGAGIAEDAVIQPLGCGESQAVKVPPLPLRRNGQSEKPC